MMIVAAVLTGVAWVPWGLVERNFLKEFAYWCMWS